MHLVAPTKEEEKTEYIDDKEEDLTHRPTIESLSSLDSDSVMVMGIPLVPPQPSANADEMTTIGWKCVEEQHQKTIEEQKNECHEAWMCLQDSMRQIEKLRNDLHFKSLQVDSLESKVNQLTESQQKHEKKHEKLSLTSICTINAKFQALKDDYHKLSEEAHANPFPDINEITSAVQSLSLQYEELKKKYTAESKERKQLHNELLELKGNIRVFCRCRPLTAEEIEGGPSSVVEFDESKDNELIINVPGATKKIFNFDHVFTPKANQEDVFADTAPVVLSVLDGYNVCIFAYGQTGTGKTFTMEGTPGNRGVNFRTLEELFRVAEERKEQYKYDISVSVLEVYNEQIRDLLALRAQQGQPAKKLEIKQVAEGIQHVPGLVEAQVHNMNEVWEVLQTGSSARAVGSTNANELSSRSHCILSVLVRGQSLIDGSFTTSKLWLVDLAGSERIGKTDAHGERLKEAQCINKSLSALGDVISALASKSSHIPYRNSKLTHLLQDSLGGDSKTLMFVQISPHERDIGETLCSLNFATRVRGVQLGLARKQQDGGEVFKYKQMAEKIRQDGKEVKKMEESLQNLETKFKAREHMCRHLQEKVRGLEALLAKEKKARLQCEAKLREQHRQSEKLPERPPISRQFTGSRNVSRRSPLKQLTNLLEPLTEDKVSSFLKSNINKQGNRSFMKGTVAESFANGDRPDKENAGDSDLLKRKKGRFSIALPAHRSSLHPPQRRISMIPMPISRNSAIETQETVPCSSRNVRPAPRRVSMISMPVSKNAALESEETVNISGRNMRTAGRTSISTLYRRTSAIPLPRTSTAVIPVSRKEASTSIPQLPGERFALTPAKKEENSSNHASHHDSNHPSISTPLTLRRLKNSHALDRFRRTIQNKLNTNSTMMKSFDVLQEADQKRETRITDTDENLDATVSLKLKPSPANSSRVRRLSITTAWGSHSASANFRAQRVLCGNRTSLKREKE